MQLRTQLADLLTADADFRSLERSLDVFCPFEAMGMVRQEIRHAYFLSYLLSPDRPHGFGDFLLRHFLRAICTNAADDGDLPMDALDVHLLDISGAIIRREWRDIDLLIELPGEDLTIIVELKIDASEHGDQLAKYVGIAQREYQNTRKIFVFLTKAGDEAGGESAELWVPLSLQSLAIEFESAVSRRVGNEPARIQLEAYLAMLRRHHLDNEELDDLAKRLWSRHKEALDFLADRRPDAMSEFFELLAKRAGELANEVSDAAGIKVVPDYHRGGSVRLAVPGWDDIPDFRSAEGYTQSKRSLLIEIIKASAVGDRLRCYLLLGPGDAELRQSVYEVLKTEGAISGKRLTSSWNRLASTSMSLGLDDDGVSIEEAYENCKKKIVKFLSDKLPQFDNALSKLS